MLVFAFLLCQVAASGQSINKNIGRDQHNVASNVNGLPVDKVTSGSATYAATTAYTTPYATPTDVVTIAGSATKTVKVVRITISSTQTTAGINQWFLVYRTTADTGGATTALTKVALDQNNAAATAAALLYTAAPTINSTVGTVRAPSILSPAPASLFQADYSLFDDNFTGQPIVLRGTAQQLALNFAGVAVPTGLSLSVTIYWTEE